jgi:hypothetical protein
MKNRPGIVALVVLNLCIGLYVMVEGKQSSAGAKDIAPVLRAQAIELVESNGQVRAQLNVEPTGEGVLRLRVETGTIRVKLGASKTGSGLALLNDSTAVGVHMLAERGGSTLTEE